MVFTGCPVAATARSMGVRIPGVVVPDWSHIARVRFEEETRRGVDASGFRATDWTNRGSGRCIHRPLDLVACPALWTREIIGRHEQDTAKA